MIENNKISPLLSLPQLRIAYNSKITVDDYIVFFIRERKEIYLLDVNNSILSQSNLSLGNGESIRNIISDGTNLCISILDDTITETYQTKETQIISFEDLLEYIVQKRRANEVMSY